MMAAVDKVKVLVIGDSGVGKTSLTHLIAQHEPISNPSWTVGCSVEVKLHEYKEGTSYQKTYFIELWDVGGSSNHRMTRSVFYNSVHGIILVHDLTNRKSQQNLQKWLAEVFSRDGNSKLRNSSFDDFDPEQFIGSNQIPVLVIGTKFDLIEEFNSNINHRLSSFAEDCGADEIFLDCRQMRSLAAGTSSAVKLTRFFDKVIEMRYHARENISPFNISDKRNRIYTSPLLTSPKLYHND
ncbi:rab-like protein 3 isoform X1 [Lycorma delicatula]|uniref:rab-like protein 3 isoform X1 n=1 Tax=Lycorma delicatula TaxID=130591 RepID=UPI003F50E9B3